MKDLFCLLVFLGLLAATIYCAIFVLFIPGVTEIVNQCQSDVMDGGLLAIGIIKVLVAWPCSGFGLWLSFVVPGVIKMLTL